MIRRDMFHQCDISKLFYVISRKVRREKFETILKYHMYKWYLYQISRTNHAIISFMARNSGQRNSARAGLLGNMAAKHSKEMYGRNKTK